VAGDEVTGGVVTVELVLVLGFVFILGGLNILKTFNRVNALYQSRTQ